MCTNKDAQQDTTTKKHINSYLVYTTRDARDGADREGAEMEETVDEVPTCPSTHLTLTTHDTAQHTTQLNR